MIKTRKILKILCLGLILIFMLNLKSYAITLPWLTISSNNYLNGDKVTLEEIDKVEIGKTLQLYTMIVYGNDLIVNDDPNTLGRFVYESNLVGINWTSSDTSVAMVDNTGKVTGIKEGKTIITANYPSGNSEDEKTITKEIEVFKLTSDNEVGISIVGGHNSIPSSPIVLHKTGMFLICLQNIPDSQKDNIRVTVENEDIAKVTNIDLCNWEDGSGAGIVSAEVNGINEGTTKIIARLTYNGNDYTGECSFDVIKSRHTLKISPASNETGLPESIQVNDTIQVNAKLETYGGSLRPEDITSKVDWSSNNTKIANVDNKGLITGIAEGTAIITAKYKMGDETITTTYSIVISDPTKSPGDTDESPTNNSDPTVTKEKLPQAGVSIKIIFVIIFTIAIALIFYKKHYNYKDIK